MAGRHARRPGQEGAGRGPARARRAVSGRLLIRSERSLNRVRNKTCVPLRCGFALASGGGANGYIGLLPELGRLRPVGRDAATAGRGEPAVLLVSARSV